MFSGMFSLAVSTFRDRWPLFVGAIVTVCLGVALVQASLLTLITAAISSSGEDETAAAVSLMGIVVGLSVFLAIFIVASTFAFTVAQRRRELALVRLAGGSGRQLRALLLGEALLLSVAGTVSGIVVGLPVMRFEGWLLARLGFAPPGFQGQWRDWIIAVSAGTGVLVALLGVLAASGRAARIRPLEALRDTGQAARVMTFSRWLIGVLFAAGGITLTILTPVVGGEGAVALSINASLVWIVSFTAFGPLLVPAIGGLLGMLGGRTTLGHLARANLRDAVRRSASTAAPVMVLMAFVAATAGTLETMAKAKRGEADRVLAADTVVASDHPMKNELAGIPGVRAVSEEAPVPLQVSLSEGDGEIDVEDFDGLAVEPVAYLQTHRMTPMAGDLRELKGASVAVTPLGGSWRLGDTVSARVGETDMKLKVVALLPSTMIGPAFLLPPEFMPASGPRVYALQTDGTAKVGMSKQAWIESLQQEQEQINLRVMLALLGLASLYTIIAIVNAVVISAADRVEEFRTHRVTGLTRGQVIGMALWEALTIAAAGLVIGGLAALSTLIGNAAAIGGMLGISVFVVPVQAIMGVAVAAAAVVGLTSVLTSLSATGQKTI